MRWSVFEIEAESLISALHAEPVLSGRIFKMIAVMISERIGDTSKRARDEVVVQASRSGTKAEGQTSVGMTAADVRSIANLWPSRKQQLRLIIPLTDEEGGERQNRGRFAIWHFLCLRTHLCFEHKVFGFFKRKVMPFSDVVALLTTKEAPTVIDVQAKGFSYQLSLPSSQTSAWNVMEKCRINALAESVTASAGPTGAAAESEPSIAFTKIDKSVMDAFNKSVRGKGGGSRRRGSVVTALKDGGTDAQAVLVPKRSLWP